MILNPDFWEDEAQEFCACETVESTVGVIGYEDLIHFCNPALFGNVQDFYSVFTDSLVGFTSEVEGELCCQSASTQHAERIFVDANAWITYEFYFLLFDVCVAFEGIDEFSFISDGHSVDGKVSAGEVVGDVINEFYFWFAAFSVDFCTEGGDFYGFVKGPVIRIDDRFFVFLRFVLEGNGSESFPHEQWSEACFSHRCFYFIRLCWCAEV